MVISILCIMISASCLLIGIIIINISSVFVTHKNIGNTSKRSSMIISWFEGQRNIWESERECEKLTDNGVRENAGALDRIL